MSGREEYKKARPVSTMALDFSEQLDGVFNLGGDIPTLMTGIEDRKQSVNNSTRELEELEARIKAMEERLKNGGFAASNASAGKNTTESPSMLAAPQTQSRPGSRPASSSRFDAPTSAPPPPPGRAPPVPTSNAPPARAAPIRPQAGYIPRMPSNISETSSLRDRGEYGVAH